MESIPVGTKLEVGQLRIPGIGEGGQITVERELGEGPHGVWYRGRVNDTEVLLTLLDPDFLSSKLVRDALMSDIAKASTIRHKNLLEHHGLGFYGPTRFICESWPGGKSVRSYILKRAARGKTIDLKTAFTLVGHVCNAVGALNKLLPHGFLTSDTVYVSSAGRVMVGATGVGPSLPAAPSFDRFRTAGLLPCVTPEHQSAPIRLGLATDTFGVAALLVELLTGSAVLHAGQDLRELGLRVPGPVVDVLQRSIAADPAGRPADVLAFKAELARVIDAPASIPAESGTYPTPMVDPAALGPGMMPPTGPPTNGMGPGMGIAPPPPFGQSTGHAPPPGFTPGYPPGPDTGPMSPRYATPHAGALSPRYATPHGTLPTVGPGPAPGGYPPQMGGPPPPPMPGMQPPPPPPVPGAAKRPGPPPPPPPAKSNVGLELKQMEQALSRLSTEDGANGLLGLDGAQPDEGGTPLTVADDDSLASLGLLDDDGSSGPADDHLVGLGEEPTDAPRRANDRFIINRDGVDLGPFRIPDLIELIRTGELRSVDYIRAEKAIDPVMVVDVPELRGACEEALRKQQEATTKASRQAAAQAAVPAATRSSSSLGTIVLVLVVLGGFAAAAWVMWQRAGGGG